MFIFSCCKEVYGLHPAPSDIMIPDFTPSDFKILFRSEFVFNIFHNLDMFFDVNPIIYRKYVL